MSKSLVGKTARITVGKRKGQHLSISHDWHPIIPAVSVLIFYDHFDNPVPSLYFDYEYKVDDE